jgi:hypothetical protein
MYVPVGPPVSARRRLRRARRARLQETSAQSAEESEDEARTPEQPVVDDCVEPGDQLVSASTLLRDPFPGAASRTLSCEPPAPLRSLLHTNPVHTAPSQAALVALLPSLRRAVHTCGNGRCRRRRNCHRGHPKQCSQCGRCRRRSTVDVQCFATSPDGNFRAIARRWQCTRGDRALRQRCEPQPRGATPVDFAARSDRGATRARRCALPHGVRSGTTANDPRDPLCLMQFESSIQLSSSSRRSPQWLWNVRTSKTRSRSSWRN